MTTPAPKQNSDRRDPYRVLSVLDQFDKDENSSSETESRPFTLPSNMTVPLGLMRRLVRQTEGDVATDHAKIDDLVSKNPDSVSGVVEHEDKYQIDMIKGDPTFIVKASKKCCARAELIGFFFLIVMFIAMCLFVISWSREPSIIEAEDGEYTIFEKTAADDAAKAAHNFDHSQWRWGLPISSDFGVVE